MTPNDAEPRPIETCYLQRKSPPWMSKIAIAMQKVEGSSPFSRFLERPAFAGLLCL